MHIMFSSKTVEMTGKLKSFVLKKLQRLSKFPALGIEHLQVVIDRVKRGSRSTSEAQVEVIAKIKGNRYAFKEIGANVYQAFYRVYTKVEQKLGKEKQVRER